VKAKKTYKAGGKVTKKEKFPAKKMTSKTTDTAKGGSVDGMARENFMKARGRAAEHMRGSAQMAGKDDKPSDSLKNRKYKKGGKVVAQGADKADVRAERKQARAKRRDEKKKSNPPKGPVKRTVTKGKAEGEKSKTVITSIGNRTRTVIKQKNKSADGVRSKRKTVYGPDTGNIRTKEKQRTNRKGKKAGMISFKEKNVDRKDFTEKNKRK